MFRYLIAINPLGFMYGSAGAFLSPENLVGRSGAKFPPDAYTLAGLFFSTNRATGNGDREDLKQNLRVAGPFWAKTSVLEYSQDFYVPIPWTKIISAKEGADEWSIRDGRWYRDESEQDLTPDCRWQLVRYWQYSAQIIKENEWAESDPWKYTSILHPQMEKSERHVKAEGGLFLENAVAMPQDSCLVYLSTHELPPDWYRFGGESHIAEITSIPLYEDHPVLALLKQPIERAFALIAPAVWGSTRLSFRYPNSPDFPKPAHMLTDKAVPYRYRAGGNLGRGRYAVPAGSVYVLEEPLNRTWWDWPEEWFPNEGYSLQRVGCGLCLPVQIEGVA